MHYITNSMLKYKYLPLVTCMSHKLFADSSKVVLLYQSGKTLSEIAKMFGTVKSTVRNTLKRNGVTLRSISESKKGKESPLKGRTHTEETKLKMRQNHADFRGEKHPRYGHKDIVGDKNPDWRGGIGSETDKGRNTVANFKWKKEVLEADCYKCVLCGVSNMRKLVTHHIEGWVQSPEKRYDTDNGVCLCRSCHGSIHAKGSEKYSGFFTERVKLRSQL